MLAKAAVLVLLAPALLREPIGQGAWHKETDPVRRRVASLLAGTPVGAESVTVVPLFARVPSEAGHGRPPELAWNAGGIAGRVVHDDGRQYLRVINPTDRAVFVPAGAVFAVGGLEVFVERDAMVPPDFAALFPARANAVAENDVDRDFRWRGILPPAATGVLLHGGVSFQQATVNRWRLHGGAVSYATVLRSHGVSRKHDALERKCARLADAAGGTAVGAVFLIANRPVSAHVFRTHALFLAALPDLLHSVAVQAREWEIRAGGAKVLAQGTSPGSAHGRAVAFLRQAIKVKGDWTESYGSGFEVISRSAPQTVLGHAVVDHRHTVLHAAYYVLGEYWPGAAQRPRTNPTPPGPPPDDGKSENAPGVVARKPRPSISEKREQDRKGNR
ncbi:MAG: ARPP-1 family domain-containing protein [Planctomycetota bacterium]|jgi:hypothetical protein